MNAIKPVIGKLIVGCVLALSLITNVHADSYYSAKDPDLPALPFNKHPELPVTEVEKGHFVVDDTAIPDTPEQAASRKLRQEAAERAKQIASNPALAKAAQDAQRTAQEATWTANLEEFLPWLHSNELTEEGEPISSSYESWQSNAIPALLELSGALGAWQAEQMVAATNYSWPFTLTNEAGSEFGMVGVIDGRPVANTVHNLKAADTLGTDELWTNGSSGLNLNGEGTQIAMWDGGDPRLTHREFTTNGVRIFDMDGPSSLTQTNHATHVSGTLGAYGVTNTAKGMANRAGILANDFNFDYSEMPAEFATNQFRLSNHSYGIGLIGWSGIGTPDGIHFYPLWYGEVTISQTEDYWFGRYNEYSQPIDAIAYASRYYLSVWSAANERGPAGKPAISQANGHYALSNNVFTFFTTTRPDDGGTTGYDTLPPQAVAKNCLTVGAVSNIVNGYSGSNSVGMSTFSSFGPADDGRIKPDVVGDGVNVYSTGAASNSDYYVDSGTSMASPNVCGSLNLLVQLHNRYAGTNQPMLACTLRGLAIHTADEAGTTAGPDYRFGWGLVNALNAAKLITNNFVTGSIPFVKEVKVPNGGSVEFTVVAKGGQPMKATICWTDPAGNVQPVALDPTNRTLVNDFDLRMIRSGVTNFPYVLNPLSPTNAATLGDNNADNVEQVVISNPVTNGDYLVRVTHKGTLKDDTGATAAQWISILVSGNVAQAEPPLVIQSFAQTGPTAVTLLWPANVGRIYQVQGRANVDSGTWTAVSGDISATKTNVAVEVPMSGDTRFYRIARVR